MDEILNDLRARVGQMIREGFDSRATIIENLVEQMEDEHTGMFTRKDVARYVDDQLLAFYAEQAEWAGESDCDRLDAAFSAMERNGVVARQNFSCCSNCGHGEMVGEMTDDGRTDLLGYAFYHVQDTERAAEGGSVYIKFGTGTASGSAEVVGQHILDALLAAGMDAGWSGSADDSVQVATSNWRKRRANELPFTDDPE